MKRIPRNEYPICPRCGGRVVAATMTSGAVNNAGLPWEPGINSMDDIMAYRLEAISLYCPSGTCNWDHLIEELSYPVTEEGAALVDGE